MGRGPGGKLSKSYFFEATGESMKVRGEHTGKTWFYIRRRFHVSSLKADAWVGYISQMIREDGPSLPVHTSCSISYNREVS